ncbi:WNT1-inducible-signaling pathway protein 2, partial [Orchesella cincta]
EAAITTERPSPIIQQTTEGGAPVDITELPVSLTPESGAAMMSSTEKIETADGISSTEETATSSSDDSDGSTDPSTNVPGEGSCYVEGKTYRNGSSIPPTTPCHIACACKNSIVHCLLVHCPPPPNNYVDCKPIYRSGVCCPEYDCGTTEGSGVTVTPEPPGGDKDSSVVTVTPEPASTEISESSSISSESAHTPDSSTPSSENLVSEQQDSSERPVTESTTDIVTPVQDQPGEGGAAGSSSETFRCFHEHPCIIIIFWRAIHNRSSSRATRVIHRLSTT